MNTIRGTVELARPLSVSGRVVVAGQIEVGGSVLTLATYLRLVQETGQDMYAVMSQKAVTDVLSVKQDALVSGQNIKTINNQSMIGSGNIHIGGGGGTDDYEDLDNLPQVNGNTLIGNKTSAQLGLAAATHSHTTSQIADIASYHDATKQDVIADLTYIRTGAASGATAVQPGDLADVATSGAYSDLSGTPTIPSALADLTDDATHRVVTDTEKASWNGKSDVYGTHAGGNWTSLTVNGTTNNIPSGGGGAAVWGGITGTLSDQSDLNTALSGKVDAVSGKGLSTEDYTSAEKSKLAGIAAGAEVNVNADWDAVSGDAQILNKPTIPAAQIQSDWNQSDNTSKDFIKSKPTSLSAFSDDLGSSPTHTHSQYQPTLVSGTNIKTVNGTSILGSGNITVDGITPLVYGTTTFAEAVAAHTNGNVLVVVYQNKTYLMTGYVGNSYFKFSTPMAGEPVKNYYYIQLYADNTWSSPSYYTVAVSSDLTPFARTSDLATVATSGSYNDLSGLPTINAVSGVNDGTNWTSLTIDGTTKAIPSGGGGGLSNYDFTFSTLSNNTTAITFAANQRCYQRETMTAGATLTFAIANKSDNYLRIYNSSASDITIAIGAITFNGVAVSLVVVPEDTIKVYAGKYVEIGIVCDENEADITVSHKSKSN